MDSQGALVFLWAQTLGELSDVGIPALLVLERTACGALVAAVVAISAHGYSVWVGSVDAERQVRVWGAISLPPCSSEKFKVSLVALYPGVQGIWRVSSSGVVFGESLTFSKEEGT